MAAAAAAKRPSGWRLAAGGWRLAAGVHSSRVVAIPSTSKIMFLAL